MQQEKYGNNDESLVVKFVMQSNRCRTCDTSPHTLGGASCRWRSSSAIRVCGGERTCLIGDSLSPPLSPPSLEGIPGQSWTSWSVTDSTEVFASKLLQKPLNILETICHFLLSVWKWKKAFFFLKKKKYIKTDIGTSEDKLPLWCMRPFSTNAALSLQIAEVLLSSTSWRSNETKWGEARRGEERRRYRVILLAWHFPIILPKCCSSRETEQRRGDGRRDGRPFESFCGAGSWKW